MPPYESSNIPKGRKRITVDLDEQLHEQLLDLLWHAQQADRDVSKTAAITRGVQLVVDELASSLDLDPERIPPRGGDLRVGRPPAP